MSNSKFRIPFTNVQLMKIASVGAVFIIGNAILMRFLVQKKLKQSPYYIQATEAVLKNRALVDLLGEPVRFGGVNLDNNAKNFSTPTEAKYEVPINGSKTNGILLLNAVRFTEAIKIAEDTGEAISTTTPNKNITGGWHLKSLEILLKDKPNEKLILLRDQAKTPEEVMINGNNTV